MKFLRQKLETMHPNAWFRYSREKWDEEFKSLYYQIPLLKRDQIYVRLMQLVASLQDGHTRARPVDQGLGLSVLLPFRTYLFTDGLYVVSATPDYAEIVGKKIIRYGNFEPIESLNLAASAYSCDNEFTRLEKGPLMLMFIKLLHALGISDHPDYVRIEIEEDNGVSRFVDVYANGELRMDMYQWAWYNLGFGLPLDGAILADQQSVSDVPLYLQNTGKYYWYTYLPHQQTLYFQFNIVGNMESESFESFCNRMFSAIDSMEINKMIIDLRLNSGGNNQLLLPLIHGIIRRDKINRQDRLFTILGRRTFSAAMSCAGALEKHTNTVFVGEPSGSLPNQFGDARSVVLPNSGLSVGISSVWWMNTDALDRRELLPPHIPVQLSFADFRNNRDPVVEKVLALKNYRTLDQVVMEAIKSSGIEAGRKAYLQYKDTFPDGWRNTKGITNRLGYQLLADKRVDQAISVFHWNVETYPDYANGWDSLGEGYMIKGDFPNAIKYYQKSVDLNPGNEHGKRMITRMKSKM